MTQAQKLRELLEVPDEQRIGQCIWNRLSAHDLVDANDRFYFLPDDVFIKVMLDDSEFCRKFSLK